MWKPEHRQAADRRGLRYPSDLTEAEWTLLKPLIPPARRGGRWREVNVREVLNGIFYVLSTGCQWAALPKDLPPKSTVHHYFMLWDWDGTLERVHDALYVAAREVEVGIVRTDVRAPRPPRASKKLYRARATSRRVEFATLSGFDIGRSGPPLPNQPVTFIGCGLF